MPVIVIPECVTVDGMVVAICVAAETARSVTNAINMDIMLVRVQRSLSGATAATVLAIFQKTAPNPITHLATNATSRVIWPEIAMSR